MKRYGLAKSSLIEKFMDLFNEECGEIYNMGTVSGIVMSEEDKSYKFNAIVEYFELDERISTVSDAMEEIGISYLLANKMNIPFFVI